MRIFTVRMFTMTLFIMKMFTMKLFTKGIFTLRMFIVHSENAKVTTNVWKKGRLSHLPDSKSITRTTPRDHSLSSLQRVEVGVGYQNVIRKV